MNKKNSSLVLCLLLGSSINAYAFEFDAVHFDITAGNNTWQISNDRLEKGSGGITSNSRGYYAYGTGSGVKVSFNLISKNPNCKSIPFTIELPQNLPGSSMSLADYTVNEVQVHGTDKPSQEFNNINKSIIDITNTQNSDNSAQIRVTMANNDGC